MTRITMSRRNLLTTGACALFLVVVGFELAKVSRAVADGGGLDLDANDIGAMLHSDVVGRAITPGFGNFESMLEGAGHEAQLHPLAPFFESFENGGLDKLAVGHTSLP
jgi:hypothetical protein